MTLPDRLNPVLLRELRQLVRRRTLPVVLGVYLAIQFLVSMAYAFGAHDSFFSVRHASYAGAPVGEPLFNWFRGSCIFFVAAVIPFTRLNRLLVWRQTAATDPQSVTLLTPAQRIDGHAAGAVVAAALVILATLPFLAFAYLLRGVSPASLLCFPIDTLAWTLPSIYLAIFLAILRLNPIGKRFIFGATLYFLSRSFLWDVLLAPIFDVHPDDGLPNAFLSLLVAVFVVWLLRAAAIARVSPRASNFRLPMRRTVSVATLLLLVLGGGIFVWDYSRTYADKHDALFTIALCPLVLLFLTAFAEAALPDGYSRRVSAAIAPGRLRRTVQYFFFTGAENGLAFVFLLQILVLSVLFGILKAVQPDGILAIEATWFLTASAVCVLYVDAALLLARAVWRSLFHRRFDPVWIPYAAFVALMTNALFSSLLANVSEDDTAFLTWFGSLPGVINALNEGEYMVLLRHVLMSVVFFAIALLMDLPGFIFSIRSFRPAKAADAGQGRERA